MIFNKQKEKSPFGKVVLDFWKNAFYYFWNKKHSILKSLIVLLTLFFTAVASYYAWKNFNITIEDREKNSQPVFKYDYTNEEKLFIIKSDDRTYIVSAKWILWNKEREIGIANFLTRDLSWYEIRNFYEWDFTHKDEVECLLFMYAQEGIPALVEITYSRNNEKSATTREFVLITRLDTEHPSIKKIKTDIKTDQEAIQLFNSKENNSYLLSAFEATEETIKLRYGEPLKLPNDRCDMELNKPRNFLREKVKY